MSRSRPPERPPERLLTPRQALLDVLDDMPRTARELSALAGLSEQDVVDHLGHLQRSASRLGLRFEITAAECRGCGFVFDRRARLNRPGRCPRCHATHLHPPRFALHRR